MSETGPVLRVVILGCGSSGGVPRVDGDWGACDPDNPKNRRSRCSLLVERAPDLKALHAGAVTRLLIDTSPDLRQQLLDNQVRQLDGVAYTHTHADQAHGIDDVRALVYRRRALLDAVMSAETFQRLQARFDYIFETPAGSGYPPLMQARCVEPGQTFDIQGAGGALSVSLFDVEHGSEPCSGIKIGPVVYTPDVNGLDDTARAAIQGAGLWVADALRETPHPSHAHLDQTLSWMSALKPGQGVLTNLHVDLDYQTLTNQLPDGVRAAYDRLSLILDETRGTILQADPV